jgi:hypothetical protein
MERDCDSKGCLVSAIINHILHAADSGYEFDRAIAVKFLLHFMGDLHQPLHLGFVKDKGGIRIWIKNLATSLHNVWDETLLEEYKRTHPGVEFGMIAVSLVDEIIRDNDPIEIAPWMIESRESITKLIVGFATETTGTVTCPIAYSQIDGSTRIRSQESLDQGWLVSRVDWMLYQLKVAG